MTSVNVALEYFSPNFSRRDAFLHYALLFLLPIEDDGQRATFATVKPLEMKAFDKL